MDIKEFQKVYLSIISILKEYETTLEAPRQRLCICGMISGIKSLYNSIIRDYDKGEFTETYDMDVTKVIANNKEWGLMIKDNHWSFYSSETTEAICPPAYETYIERALDYHPCNNENIIEWSYEAYDFGAFTQPEGRNYRIRITRSGEFINY